MISKFQQGGQAQQQQILMQAAQVLQSVGYNITDSQGNLDQRAFLQAVVQYGQEKLGVQVNQQNIGQVITTIAQQGAQMAKKGAKLNYLKKITGNCPQGTELVYFKAGGKVCSKCEAKKGQKGGVMDNIKKEIMKDGKKIQIKNKTSINPNDTVHVNKTPYSLTNMDGSKVNPKSPYPKYSATQYQKDRKSKDPDARRRAKKADEVSSEKCGGKVKKDCGGSKLLAKKGIKAKACPKCGKIHTGKCGGEMKKHQLGGILTAMKKFKNGGSLNGVPFMQEGNKLNNQNIPDRSFWNLLPGFGQAHSELIKQGRTVYDRPLSKLNKGTSVDQFIGGLKEAQGTVENKLSQYGQTAKDYLSRLYQKVQQIQLPQGIADYANSPWTQTKY